MALLSGMSRKKVAAAVRALQDELANGPRAILPPELEELGALYHAREERARTQEPPERDLLSALADPAALIGDGGRIRVANAAFDSLAPGGKAVGLSPVEITRSAELHEAVIRALEGTGRRLEYETPDRRVWLAHVAPLLHGDTLLVVRDVTEAKRAEAIRRDFVANASHELRTPVTAIRGAADTLLAGALSDAEAARRFVDIIARHADRLANLTRDLLDLSRLESGLWPMRFGEVAVQPVARAVLDLHADRAAARGVTLLQEVPAAFAVRADARALEQVLVNLVDNAIKYSPAGGRVTVSAAGAGAWGRVRVQDTGPGVDPRHLPRLFERFYRADPGRSREQGGTGLGLAIVKHLMQQQGGTVGVESGPGGSCFWIELPAAAQAPDRPAT
jgi:two-component system phosphate regulon sensor histidine kinase PhoR